MPTQTTRSICSSTHPPLLRLGDQGPVVNEMRILLANSDRGFGVAGITVGDTFTTQIEAMVKEFQRQVFLVQDGIVGPKTWKALCANAPVQMPIIRQGSYGIEVRQAQERLQQCGYYTAALDGDFGPLTHSAVVQFQADQHLTVDGIIGPMTWAALSRV